MPILIIHLQLQVLGYVSENKICDMELRILIGNQHVQFYEEHTILKVNIYFSSLPLSGCMTRKWDCYRDADSRVYPGHPHTSN